MNKSSAKPSTLTCVKDWVKETQRLLSNYFFTLWIPVILCGWLFYLAQEEGASFALKVLPFVLQPWIMLYAFVELGTVFRYSSVPGIKTFTCLLLQPRISLTLILLAGFYTGLATLAYELVERLFPIYGSQDWVLWAVLALTVLLYLGTALASLFVAEERCSFTAALAESFKFVYQGRGVLVLTLLVVVLGLLAGYLLFFFLLHKIDVAVIYVSSFFYFVLHTAMYYAVYVAYKNTRHDFSVMFKPPSRKDQVIYRSLKVLATILGDHLALVLCICLMIGLIGSVIVFASMLVGGVFDFFSEALTVGSVLFLGGLTVGLLYCLYQLIRDPRWKLVFSLDDELHKKYSDEFWRYRR